MLQPKKEKFRKQFKPDLKGRATSGSTLAYGDYGLKAMAKCWITSRQIEAARKTIVRETNRKGKLWLRVFPDRPITAKPNEVGMGKGKGEPIEHVFPLRPGKMVFELGGVPDNVAREAFRKAAQKLPVEMKLIVKHSLQ